MPILTQTFHDKYGWRGASLLLCGVNLHGVVCAMLFKPIAKEYYILVPPDDREVSNNIDNLKGYDQNAIQRCASLMEQYLDISLFSNFFLFSKMNGSKNEWVQVDPHVHKRE